jgi:CheY-like chemotaxis protein
LTRQLLAFSRKQMLQPRLLDLNRVVQNLRPMLERLMGEDVEVRVALEAMNGTVRADPHHLEQVIMNLAVNARDAMPLGGRLLIETAGVELDAGYARLHPEANAGRYVMLSVSDSGLGMDDETRRRIFEPFFTTKPAGHGTGLGLSMVQGIVVQSGGHISVYSEPDRGTTFKIYLPAVADQAADAGLLPAGDAVLGGSETILVVEDLAEVRTFAAAALEAYGYRVIQAENAAEALLTCEREPGCIHLVLTDVVMPNLGGPELASRLRTLRPGIKVLLMSGYTDNAIAINGALEERFHFIEKPFSPEQLARKVRAVLGD